MPNNVKEIPNGMVGAWIRFVLQAMLIPIVLLVGANYVNIAKINSSRYTALDASAKELRDANNFLQLWNAIGELNTRMAELPPDKYRAYVNSLEARIRVLEITMAKAQKD